uniref:Retrovirus-related Pol polyprotein from transposon TNT 1-94 n=1 Tax=Ananas comosus var. bracteatus TaxID=296719 RepID=A0A6V7NH03_ANACO|nr:unnamed protein product [Ananas comosus var. bracteatus]
MSLGRIGETLSVRRLFDVLGPAQIGLWYPKGTNFNLIGFSDADFAGCKVDRKSTSGTCQFLGHSLSHGLRKSKIRLHFQPPKPSISRRIVVVHKFLWMKQTLEDFGVHQKQVPIKCDNTSAINISRNPIQHSRN